MVEKSGSGFVLAYVEATFVAVNGAAAVSRPAVRDGQIN